MADQAEIDAGNVEFELDGEPMVLRPTLAACMAINKIAGGMNGAVNQIASLNFEVICDVISHGLGANPVLRQKTIPEKVFRTGMINLAEPCIRFIRIINNGGRPPNDEEEENPPEAIESPSEKFYRRLAKQAMGNLGWTPDVAMGADVNAILIAIEGRGDLLQSIFGKAPGQEPKGKLRHGDWRAMVRTHNRQYRKPKGAAK